MFPISSSLLDSGLWTSIFTAKACSEHILGSVWFPSNIRSASLPLPSRFPRKQVDPEGHSGYSERPVLQICWAQRAGVRRPGTLCRNAYTCTHLSSSNNMQRNCLGLNVTWVRAHLGQFLDERYRDQNTQLPLWRGWSKSRILRLPPALNAGWGVGRPPKPPIQPSSEHIPTLALYKEQALPRSGKEQAREPVVYSRSPLLQQGPQKSLAWISCLTFSQFLLIGGGQELWLVTDRAGKERTGGWSNEQAWQILLVEEAGSLHTHTSVRLGTVNYRQVWGYFRALLQAAPFKWLTPHCLYQCYDFNREHENFRCSLLVIFFLEKKIVSHISMGISHQVQTVSCDWAIPSECGCLSLHADWHPGQCTCVCVCVCVFMCMCCHLILTSLFLIKKENKCQCYQTCLVGNQLRVKKPYFLIKWV